LPAGSYAIEVRSAGGYAEIGAYGVRVE
jgi:hypothetical protein